MCFEGGEYVLPEWQWVERKKQFGYVTKKFKRNQKQPDIGVCQVQPLVSDRVDNETRTTVYSEERNDISGMVGMSPNYSGEGDGLKVRGFTRWTR